MSEKTTESSAPSSAPNTAEIKATHEPYHHEGGNLPAHSHHDDEVVSAAKAHDYWRANVKLMAGLLVIWFIVSFGAGVLLVRPLNDFNLGGFPLGFWFAQQGSILVFVALIFFYANRMHKIERHFGVDDDD